MHARILIAFLLSLPAMAQPQMAFQQYSIYAPESTFFYGIATGPDGMLWFTDIYHGSIHQMSTTGAVHTFQLPSCKGVSCGPYGIAAGSDGALWFTGFYSSTIGRITTDGVVTALYAIPTREAKPTGIALGSDGAMWFTEYYGQKIGRITTQGVITEYRLPNKQPGPDWITAGPDGALWFTELNTNTIGRITTAGAITEYAVPNNPSGYLEGITTGPDGALWFGGNAVGRITTAGAITVYPIPAGFTGFPYAIATGPDGALWYSVSNGNTIGRVTTSGSFTQYITPQKAASGTYAVTTGPDGELWFTAGGSIEEGAFVTANLSAAPPEGHYTTTLTFSGSGFAPGEEVCVYTAGVGSPVLAGAKADATGSITATAQAPASAYGDRIFIGTGQSSGKLGAANFSMKSGLTVTPAAGPPGSQVTVQGYGFIQDDTVDIYWNDYSDWLGSVNANSRGTFARGSAFTFTVPQDAVPGAYPIYANGTTLISLYAAVFFTVQ